MNYEGDDRVTHAHLLQYALPKAGCVTRSSFDRDKRLKPWPIDDAKKERVEERTKEDWRRFQKYETETIAMKIRVTTPSTRLGYNCNHLSLLFMV